MSPSDKVAELYSQAWGSLSIAFYDSQGYDGSILTLLHTGNIEHFYTVNYRQQLPNYIEQAHLWEANRWTRNSLTFMVPSDLLPNSHMPTTDP
jgi:hypothetical protein